MSWKHKAKRASAARVSSAIKSALAGVGEGPKDCAGVLVHHLTKVHGDGEQDDQEEKVYAKQRMQKSAQVFWGEHVEMHPDESDDGQEGEYTNDDPGGALGPIGGCKGLLDEGEFRAGVFGVGMLVFGAHAGFLSEASWLRRVVTP
jgi:hypothetical protein